MQNEVAYRMVACTYARGRELSKVKECLARMKDNGIAPTVATYTAVMAAITRCVCVGVCTRIM